MEMSKRMVFSILGIVEKVVVSILKIGWKFVGKDKIVIGHPR